jgi:hypothetical protein
MTLTDRIKLQTEATRSRVVRLPARDVLALIAKADAAQLKAAAWDRLMRQQARRRQVDRTASAIAANPKGM